MRPNPRQPGQVWWEEKRGRVVEPGRTVHRTGPREQTSSFMHIAKEASEAPGIRSFMFIPWPKYAGDYPRDLANLSGVAKQRGLLDLMHDPDRQLGLPVLIFFFSTALCTVWRLAEVACARSSQ